jgi:hypothetical protein
MESLFPDFVPILPTVCLVAINEPSVHSIKPVFCSGIPVGASVSHSNHKASLLAQTSEQVRVSHFVQYEQVRVSHFLQYEQVRVSHFICTGHGFSLYMSRSWFLTLYEQVRVSHFIRTGQGFSLYTNRSGFLTLYEQVRVSHFI